VSVDGQTLEGQALAPSSALNEKLGQNARLRIRRGGEELELELELELEISVGFVELVNYRIVENQSPTPEQLRVREAWLKR
jgi:hypothetical protein